MSVVCHVRETAEGREGAGSEPFTQFWHWGTHSWVKYGAQGLGSMGWADSSISFILQLLEASSSPNRTEMERGEVSLIGLGKAEIVRKILVILGSWIKLWGTETSKSWVQQICNSNFVLKDPLFVTFTILIFKPWDSNLPHHLGSSGSLGISTFVYSISSTSLSQVKEEVETKELSTLCLQKLLFEH